MAGAVRLYGQPSYYRQSWKRVGKNSIASYLRSKAAQVGLENAAPVTWQPGASVRRARGTKKKKPLANKRLLTGNRIESESIHDAKVSRIQCARAIPDKITFLNRPISVQPHLERYLDSCRVLFPALGSTVASNAPPIPVLHGNFDLASIKQHVNVGASNPRMRYNGLRIHFPYPLIPGAIAVTTINPYSRPAVKKKAAQLERLQNGE
jgi:hypothetical protein